MFRQHWKQWLIILIVAAGFAGCEARCSTANIPKAVLAKDKDGNQPTTTFAPADTFWCIVSLANAPDDTKVKAVWTAVETPGVSDQKLDEKEMVTGSGVIQFSMSLPRPWPAGKYKVDLYLDGKLNRTLEFKVEAAGVPVPGGGGGD
jgi:hypothetical protein